MKTELTTLVVRPPNALALLVLAHGSGAGMRHFFMEGLVEALARHNVATCRYEFPYMEAGKSFPDRPPVLVERVALAAEEARRSFRDLPVFAGGKSLGGRMTSTAAAEGVLGSVHGIVFYGFPLHSMKKPGTGRAAHLAQVRDPMLFLQGTRDRLADLSLLEPVLQGLNGDVTLHRVDDADHGFHVRRSSGRDDQAVLEELAMVTRRWVESRLSSAG